MKKYVKEYKGYKVPDGATHYNEENMLWPKCFIDAKHGRIDKMDGKGWVLSEKTMPTTAIELTEAPQEWMPEVGEDCMVMHFGELVQCKYVGLGIDDSYVIQITSGHNSGVLDSMVDSCGFHPLKTQQEKDREAFVKGLVKVLNSVPNGTSLSDLHTMAEKAYDAGYTAPKADDNDQE